MNAPQKGSELAFGAPAQDITLDDKWTLERGRAFMTGTQALIRLPMMQRERDLKAGLNTAGYITGYRGSPVTSVDMTATKAKKYLDEHHVKFHPGMNEDLAATAVWGTQQTNLFEVRNQRLHHQERHHQICVKLVSSLEGRVHETMFSAMHRAV